MTPEELYRNYSRACEYYVKQLGFPDFQDYNIKNKDNKIMYISRWNETTGVPAPSEDQLLSIPINSILQPIAMQMLKVERNRLLSESDKYVISDFPITIEKKEECKIYRQILRDLPSNSNPNLNTNNELINVIFPTFTL